VIYAAHDIGNSPASAKIAPQLNILPSEGLVVRRALRGVLENCLTLRHLVAGLGNPGREYRLHRHNVGYMVLDELARRYELLFSRQQAQALVVDLRLGERQVLLAKPKTYMNLSGNSVGQLLNFYQIPDERFILVFDDIDLPIGTLRIRPGGGSAGQNGAKSVIQRLGTQEFPRLRIGVDRPPGKKAAANYVLRPFSKEQQEVMEFVLPRAADAVEEFVRAGIDAAMNKFNGIL